MALSLFDMIQRAAGIASTPVGRAVNSAPGNRSSSRAKPSSSRSNRSESQRLIAAGRALGKKNEVKRKARKSSMNASNRRRTARKGPRATSPSKPVRSTRSVRATRKSRNASRFDSVTARKLARARAAGDTKRVKRIQRRRG